MQEYRLKRKGDVDLVFRGELLAEQSSAEPGAPRWAEIRIYRTESGKYVTYRLGRSAVPGEADKITVRIVNEPGKVGEALRTTMKNATFLSNLALDAIDEAGEKDPAIAQAAVERI